MSSGARRSARTTRRAIHPVSENAPRHNLINRLPDEILREIFLHYNHTIYGSTITLLRVCRLWHVIASSTSSLWNKLCFAPMIVLIELRKLDRFGPYMACGTPHELAIAIRRLNGMKFELVCVLSTELGFGDASYWDGLEPVWFEQQCRGLFLLVEGSLDSSHHLLHNMTALEELSISEMDRSALGFMREVEAASLRLNLLELPGGFTSELALYTTLLGRLKTLTVETHFHSSRCLSAIMAAAGNLEKLHWDGSGRSDYTEPLLPSSSSMKHVVLTNAGLSTFSPPGVYAHVIDLKIRFTNQTVWPFSDSQAEITMLSLKKLILEGRWDALISIRAPSLLTLKLRRSTETMSKRLEALRKTQLRPQVLRVERCVAEAELARMLETTWTSLKELHITLGSRNDYLRAPLINVLSGGRSDRSILPDIRAITILLLKPDTVHADLTARMSQSMKEIGGRRKHRGKLALLRCGWVPWIGKTQEGGMENWPNQEWVDFL